MQLHLQAKTCEFGSLTDSILRDQVVLETKDGAAWTKLLSKYITLGLCQATEEAQEHTVEVQSERNENINSLKHFN